MKFYDSSGPNPRIVRMFMAEKGIEKPKQTVDLRGGENRQPSLPKASPSCEGLARFMPGFWECICP
jgi:glutathione S-transferase